MLGELLRRYPSPHALAAAPPADLEGLLQPLGLHRKRALSLARFSREYEAADVCPPGGGRGAGRGEGGVADMGGGHGARRQRRLGGVKGPLLASLTPAHPRPAHPRPVLPMGVLWVA